MALFVIFEFTICRFYTCENFGYFSLNPEFVQGRMLDLQHQGVLLLFCLNILQFGYWPINGMVFIACIFKRFETRPAVIRLRRALKLTGLILLGIYGIFVLAPSIYAFFFNNWSHSVEEFVYFVLITLGCSFALSLITVAPPIFLCALFYEIAIHRLELKIEQCKC